MADRASQYSRGWEEQAMPNSAIGFVLFHRVLERSGRIRFGRRGVRAFRRARADYEADDKLREGFADQTDQLAASSGDRPIDVPITSVRRSGSTCENAGQRSVQSSVDNCYRDQAVINAAQLADLLNGANALVVRPDPFN